MFSGEMQCESREVRSKVYSECGKRIDIRRTEWWWLLVVTVTTQSQSAQLQGTMVNSVTLYVTFTIISLHISNNLADIYFGNQGDYG